MVNQVQTILAIETSCDETSVAVMKKGVVLSNVVYSQLDLHAAYGGVVPSIAKLEHEKKIGSVYQEALEKAHTEESELDLIAVTVGPGLAIALEVGINFAKSLAISLGIPLAPISHMEGHLLSAFAELAESPGTEAQKMLFPSLGLLVSGGHTEFIRVSGVGEYKKIGESLDDACGEAFDKVGVMLGLGYPGGPKVSQLAITGGLSIRVERDQQTLYARAISRSGEDLELPLPMATSPKLDMSYSGLKTAIKQLINQRSDVSEKLNIRETGEGESLSTTEKAELAQLFEFAAIEVLLLKLDKALKLESGFKQIWLGGGVVANKYFQTRLKQFSAENDIDSLIPHKSLFGDNAAMIANVAYLRSQLGALAVFTPGEFHLIDRNPNLDFD